MSFSSYIFQSLMYKNFIFLNPNVITLNKISNNSSESFYNQTTIRFSQLSEKYLYRLFIQIRMESRATHYTWLLCFFSLF